MTDTEHEELVELERKGKVLIGVDRVMARRFYTDTSIAEIEKRTGEPPYFEKMVVWLSFVLAPLALVGSIILAFLAFGWWGFICLLVCPLVYVAYWSSSPRGASRIFLITIFLFLSTFIHFFWNFGFPRITGFALVFLFSLWCVRFLYCSSTFLLRCFIIRNPKAFSYLKEYLVIRCTE